MGYSILRAEPRAIGGAAAMLRHALREDYVPNAIPDAPPPERLAGVTSSQAGMAIVRKAVDEAKAAKRWQKSVKPVLDVLVTFSHEDQFNLTPEEQDGYFRQALEFVKERFGGEANLLSAVMHRDESTPHMQVLMLAREKDGKKLGATQYMGDRGNLRKMQDAFWQSCGKQYGLKRGEPRTGAKHLPVRQLYSALAAGAELPQLVEVPEVSVKDKFLAPEKIGQREKAIEHNKAEIERLRAMAVRGGSLHPTVLAAQSKRYRESLRQADEADKQVQQALKRVAEARSEVQAMERCLSELDKRHAAKIVEFESLNRDIDRLRTMRDREAGLGHNQPG